jgi:hypothetical protein
METLKLPFANALLCFVNANKIWTCNEDSFTGREITAGGSAVKVTGQLNFSSDIPNFWPVKLFSLKQSLVKYTPKNVTIFPV